MAFVEDMIFVVGLTGLVYFITDELLLIASASHKHSKTKMGSSRINVSLKNHHKGLIFNDVVQKDSIFDDTREAKVDDFAQRECSEGGQFKVFDDAQEAEVDDFAQRECSGGGQFKVFNDDQEVKVDDFVQRECSGVGQSMIFNDTQESKVDDFVQRECSGVGQSCNGEFKKEVEVGSLRKCSFDERHDLSGGEDQVVDQSFECSRIDQGVEMLFDEVPHRDEGMEGEESVCFNVSDEIDRDEEEGWEDDWEGIERTELEKQFGVAVAFVNSKNNADCFFGVEGSVKIKLYALHKVAIEGICMKPQPMALKVYSRAKWNAWKQLGNISREEAMEKYITLLSRTIPGWREDMHKCKSMTSFSCSLSQTDIIMLVLT